MSFPGICSYCKKKRECSEAQQLWGTPLRCFQLDEQTLKDDGDRIELPEKLRLEAYFYKKLVLGK